MENCGVIIRHLRTLADLSVQKAAAVLGRSTGWISEIENNCGSSRITDAEFNDVVLRLRGTAYRPMFKTWVANHKNRERIEKTFDGAVLKFIRKKQEISLKTASKLSGLSSGYISRLETGVKPVSLEMRNRLMAAYGYSPSSFKNLASDPARSKVIPPKYKLEILLKALHDSQIETTLELVQELARGANPAEQQLPPNP